GSDSIHDDALLEWVGRLWADDPFVALADYWQTATLLGGGPWLPAAVLHLKDPRRFPLWDDEARRGLAALDDGNDPSGSPAEGYRLFAEGCDDFPRRVRLHPTQGRGRSRGPGGSEGVSPATVRSRAEPGGHKGGRGRAPARARSGFAAREPLVELCRALACRYVEPVLNRQLGWDLETAAKAG